jgi:hypothetical protein
LKRNLILDVKSSAQDKQEVAFSQEVAVLWFFRNFPNFVKVNRVSRVNLFSKDSWILI